MRKRKICVVTGARAEYGLLYWLMREIQRDQELELQVLVTGSHLSPEFDLTYQVIEEDGFPISAKVEMLLSSDTPTGIIKSMGLGLIGFADALERLSPDMLVILGDRYEMMAVAQAGLVAKIPIAHLYGGETTAGAMDEAIRHAITKMAHLHFVAAEPYRQRVIQLGEDPKRVFNFGSLGVDNIQRLTLLDRQQLEEELECSMGKLNFLVTYHPETLSRHSSQEAVTHLIQALDCFPDAHILFTKSNADPDSRIIGQLLESYASQHSGRVKIYTSLGHVKYLSVIRQIDVVIGNSSSGLTEVPALKKPTVNIGLRQQGRLKAASVIDCSFSCESIVSAIQKALSPDFQKSLPYMTSPYGRGNTAPRIKEVLKSWCLKDMILKTFYDFPPMSQTLPVE